jgi:hypothetical protein
MGTHPPFVIDREEVTVKIWSGILVTVGVLSCTPTEDPEPRGSDPQADAQPVATASLDLVLQRQAARIDAEAARIDSIFQPLPLLRPAQEDALRRFGNAEQLARARELGVGRLTPPERIAELRAEGALVTLEDTEHWVVRDLDYSQPLAVPSVHALLTEIGERFQARLADLDAPPYRIEVSSVMRTAEDQAALRRVNPNAALGESTHEFGTTVDVLYSAFAAPIRPIVEVDTGEADWMEPFLHRYAVVAAERVAGRRALELKAILGEVLLEMQNEGKVMVTLERLQPVYHMTVSRRL